MGLGKKRWKNAARVVGRPGGGGCPVDIPPSTMLRETSSERYCIAVGPLKRDDGAENKGGQIGRAATGGQTDRQTDRSDIQIGQTDRQERERQRLGASGDEFVPSAARRGPFPSPILPFGFQRLDERVAAAAPSPFSNPISCRSAEIST